MSFSLICPRCASSNIVKNGRSHNGKQNHRCKACGRQFVENAQNQTIDDDTEALIDRLLREELSLTVMARVANVPEDWLQRYIYAKYSHFLQQVSINDRRR